MKACMVRAASLSALCALSLPLFAHDEDWRKLEDLQPPVIGPIWRLGDEVERDSGFDSQNIELFSRIPINNFPGAAVGNASDCWGYTSPTGREIAIIGLYNGHGFVDITVPSDPQILAHIQSPSSTWHDVKVVGEHAYAVTEGGGGLQVIDLSQVDSGQVTLATSVNLGGHTTTHNIAANEESQHVYLCGANIGNGGLVAIDVSDPLNPVISGAFTTRYVHDAQVVTYPAGFGAFSGREIAYCFSESRVDIVDVTNKSGMQLLTSAFYSGTAYTHQGWLSEDLQYLYVNDELDESNFGFTTRTRVFRVWEPGGLATPSNPVFLGHFTTGLPAIDHNLYTHDGLIYQANYRSGLRVFDASIPDAPVQTAYFDSFGGSDSADFNGAWSVYPYFPSGNVIVSDLEQGLLVLSVESPQVERLLPRFASPVPEIVGPGPLNIQATVQQQNVTLDPASVRLVVLDGSGAEQAVVPMIHLGGSVYEAQTPPLECGSRFTLRVTADSAEGLTYYSLDADGRVLTDFQVAATDNAESPAGWTTGGDAVAGLWGIGAPVGDRGGPGADADGSGQAWLTGPGAGNTDVDNGSAVLTSPVYDLSGGGEIKLSYWYGTVAGGEPDAGDGLFFEVSSNGGADWTQALAETDPQSAWREAVLIFQAGGDAPPSDAARVRITATDVNGGSVVEAGIDAIEVRLYGDCLTDCGVADLTTTNTNPGDAGFGAPDGSVDGADLSFYIEAWLGGQAAVADLTTINTNPGDASYGLPDGVVDGADLSYYVEQWLAGCA